MPLRAFMEHNPPTSESLQAQGVETYDHPTIGEEMVKEIIECKPVGLTKMTAPKLGLLDLLLDCNLRPNKREMLQRCLPLRDGWKGRGGFC